MKKGEIYEGIVEKAEFPNHGILTTVWKSGENPQTECSEEEKRLSAVSGQCIMVKNVLPGQSIRFRVSKIRNSVCEGRLLKVVKRSPLEEVTACPHFELCGGCIYQTLPYEEQIRLKTAQLRELLERAISVPYVFEGVKESPRHEAYRNKMEFSFGDEEKGGALALGMHRRSSFYDIVTVENCQIVDKDYRKILVCTLNYFRREGLPFYHRLRHSGYLRHLVVRKGVRTGELLVNLVTATPTDMEAAAAQDISWSEAIRALDLEGMIVGILHTYNDSVADVVQGERTEILYGRNYFYEELLGLRFKISPFSFFQTNSLGAEVLYRTVRDYIGDTTGRVIFDLYSGTGTIAQILAPVAQKVIGVEIVEEAVRAARANARLNGLDNCFFLAGDVLKAVDELSDKPDLIVLDPPRDGIHPRALHKIINFGVGRIVYISCKPTSLVRDLELLQSSGYMVEKCVGVDMFPSTVHVETVCLMSRTGK